MRLILKHGLLAMAMPLALLSSCGQDDVSMEHTPKGPDASKAVTFTDFQPKKGASRTKLFITGSNFGNDPSRIKLTIGGISADVIGCDGNVAYAMVPKFAYSGIVSLSVLDDKDGILASHTFDKIFNYQKQLSVGTLFRHTDNDGKALTEEFVTGDFSKAGTGHAMWAVMDSKPGEYKQLFFTSRHNGVNMIDLMTNRVSNVIQQRGNELSSFCFDGDTLFLPDQNGHFEMGDYTLPNCYYALRSENFARTYVYSYGPSAYTIAINPKDHCKFFVSWLRGGFYKLRDHYNEAAQRWESRHLFDLNTVITNRAGQSLRANCVVHPSGDYLYYLCEIDGGYLVRSDYNYETHEYGVPYLVAGSFSEWNAYAEGVGISARFSSGLVNGCFVKNDDYVNQGKSDYYDFYLADIGNHCIRRITPDGATSLFAGRSNQNVDGRVFGYIDGDPTQEARFYGPSAVCYDNESHTFYVFDYWNAAVRTIMEE